MSRVFVSHASKDLELAREVHRWLIEAGHKVFLAQDLAVGEDWKQQLRNELRKADAVVCMVTSAYVASPWCTYEVSTAQSLDGRLLPVQAEQGVDHPLLKSVQHTDLTRDPDKVRTSLIEELRRINAARFARRCAQYAGVCTAIAAVVVIALDLLPASHSLASRMAARPTATASSTALPTTIEPVTGSMVGAAPAPGAAFGSQPGMHPGPMPPGAPPRQPGPGTGFRPSPHTKEPHRYSVPFQLANNWTFAYQYTHYQGRDVAADGTPPYPNQEYGLRFVPDPNCHAYRVTDPCAQGQWLDSAGQTLAGSLPASVAVSPDGLVFTGINLGNPEGFPDAYAQYFQGWAANDTTQPLRFTGTWIDVDGNTGTFTLVPR